ncbi:Amt family ammonium transporter [Anaerosolibacter carboniphilus]|uniref:Ammonium transporter n=1 Tax=Anaerosolibacter carboniphilus TaxID=1417629 RepID=A0A841KZ71_9FIRM|nr:ammonium transporter [Anaerosolibacter carboniphilus]MBB6216212.1 Amt family ammonium transporter [Anaerosolibacter carboniphilus]
MDYGIAIDTVWVLVATALVFFMQAGFAMVETGFTRAKNAGNIIMKNLMDFAVGSVAFWVLGFGIMFGPDLSGYIGKVDFLSLGSFEHLELSIPKEAFLIFQTVFCATAATIVSGAMAERTKFSSYLIYSLVISAVIYPIAGHWIWGGGWLAQLGFHDFAGSTVVHSLGGWAALMGAWIIGPRIGKYTSDGKTRVIKGHSLTLGALGVFILWFGWFGFNPGSTLAGTNTEAISHIFVTTNLSAAAGAIASMILSWSRYKKPDVSMTLNGALAGLVGITAGTDIVSPSGAVMIGIISGIVVVLAIEFIENVLKIDDPVGAISVHGICGAVGTILVGVFATDGGLLYGGGTKLLLVQLIGVGAVALWTNVTAFYLFKAINKTVGLRVNSEEEEEGLDKKEHGTESYADFQPRVVYLNSDQI